VIPLVSLVKTRAELEKILAIVKEARMRFARHVTAPTIAFMSSTEAASKQAGLVPAVSVDRPMYGHSTAETHMQFNPILAERFSALKNNPSNLAKAHAQAEEDLAELRDALLCRRAKADAATPTEHSAAEEVPAWQSDRLHANFALMIIDTMNGAKTSTAALVHVLGLSLTLNGSQWAMARPMLREIFNAYLRDGGESQVARDIAELLAAMP
jgi:hypothetical protein